MNVSSYFGSLTLLSVILTLPLKFVRSVFCSGYDKLWLHSLYTWKECVSCSSGYSVVCLLIGCHFNSHFQTVYSLTELLLFLSITGWGRWTTSHYNYNLANFSLYICHLLPYVFWSISFIKIKVIVFPWWSDHPPLSLLQSLSFMSACLWCLCLKGTSFLWVSFTGHRIFHLFHFDFCIFIIKVCHKQYIVSFFKKIQSDNLYLLIGTFSTFTYNYWYFGL